MPPRTETRAATRSATSRAPCRLRCRRCARSVSVASPRSASPRRAAPRTPFRTAVGRMAEASAGKDSVTGHWEMMGIVLERAFPVFPDGFADGSARRVLAADRPRRARQQGRIRHRDHRRARAPSTCGPARWIVYTSADSVFQIAAHEAIVPVPELYRACEVAYHLAGEGLGVGRVIARPFVGAPGSFRRTANRRDFALPPAGETLLDRLTSASRTGRGDRQDRGSVRRARHHDARFTRRATTRGWTRCSNRWRCCPDGLIFANLVDFDTQYGHRNDVGRLRAEPRAVRRAAGGAPSAPARRRSAGRHRRPRQRSGDAQHRSFARVRAGHRRGRARARRRRPGHAADLRRPRPDARGPVRRRPARPRHELSA